MTAVSGAGVHHFAPHCLLGLFDAAEGLADWSEFDAEAERWGIEVRGLSRQGLRALIKSSTRQVPTTEHRRLHQEGTDFVRWVGQTRGPEDPVALYGRPYFSLLVRLRWGRIGVEVLMEHLAGSAKAG